MHAKRKAETQKPTSSVVTYRTRQRHTNHHNPSTQFFHSPPSAQQTRPPSADIPRAKKDSRYSAPKARPPRRSCRPPPRGKTRKNSGCPWSPCIVRLASVPSPEFELRWRRRRPRPFGTGLAGGCSGNANDLKDPLGDKNEKSDPSKLRLPRRSISI